MTRFLLTFCTGASLLLGGPIGCAHMDRARADYHEDRARHAAAHGHLGEAIHEERKANRADEQARHDPLP